MKITKAENINTTHFGNQYPQRKTFRALHEYFASTGDRFSAKFYGDLENRVRARLYGLKSAKTQREMLNYSDEMSEKLSDASTVAEYCKKQLGYSFRYIKESLLSLYYNI